MIDLCKEENDMIKCLMDVTVPQDSKCAKCCIYCDEKSHCESVCEMGAVEGRDENFIACKCINAYEEE